MTPSKVVKKLASLDTGLGEGRRTANDLFQLPVFDFIKY